MPQIAKVTAIWSGFSGAPGYSKFAYDGITDVPTANQAGAAVRAFFVGLNSYLLTSWSVQVQSNVQLFDDQTGHLVQEVTMSAVPAVVPGVVTVGAKWNGGAGAYVTWTTGVIRKGRHVKGRTFLVPLVTQNDTDGTLLPAFVTAAQAAANGLITAAGPKLAVWAKDFNTATPPAQIGGQTCDVLGYIVPDKTGILRSRRD